MTDHDELCRLLLEGYLLGAPMRDLKPGDRLRHPLSGKEWAVDQNGVAHRVDGKEKAAMSRIEVQGTDDRAGVVWRPRIVIEPGHGYSKDNPLLALSDTDGGVVYVRAKDLVAAANAAWELVKPR